MTKSQIIEILQQYVDFTEYERGQVNNRLYNAIADAILALPIDVPTEEEANDESDRYGKLAEDNGIPDYGVGENASLDFVRGTNWMKDEIIKRNK